AELWEHVLDGVPDGFRRQGDSMICPDGRPVDLAVPGLRTLAHLLQEDLLLLQRRGEEHVLIAGVLCFPASWTLAEKMGRPLSRIHRPVPAYDDALAGRVQRLFDHVRPGRPLWRANALGYADAALYQPMTEAAPRPVDGAIRFLRSERQTVLRLPKTGAILFAVHTYVVPVDRLTPEQRDTCPVL
ncbi:MAG: heme-dependent oxidative N-demethylase subunit alpha family protein, partial [Pseudomonadota bacterium]